jgi:glucokinase
LRLLAYLQPRLGHISYERVCSGVGIPNIYSFLRDSGHYEEPDWLRQELDAAGDKNACHCQYGPGPKSSHLRSRIRICSSKF